MSKLAYVMDRFGHLDKLNTSLQPRVLHKYRGTEKQDRRIHKEAGGLG